MKTQSLVCISCLFALVLINTVQAAIDAVSLAVIVVAGIAIAKEKLIAAEIHRNYINRPLGSAGYEAPQTEYGAPSRSLKRGKRQTDDDFDPLFESASQLDTDDCAKLMVCNVFEKPSEILNTFERRIYNLFAQYEGRVDSNSPKAAYQLAASTGSLKQKGFCQHKYQRCKVNPESLINI